MDGTVPFNRMPRIQEPLPQGEVRLPAPPAAPSPPRLNWLLLLLPLTGVLAMAGFYGALRGSWLLAAPMIGLSLVSALTSIVATLVRQSDQRNQLAAQSAAYAQALAQKRAELEAARQVQQRIRAAVDPDPVALLARARARHPRLWERRPNDADFLCLRLGLGVRPSTVLVAAPHPDMPDPRLEEAHRLEAEYRAVPDVPLTVNLRAGPLGVAGPLPVRADLARALLVHLAAHHSPDEVHLLAVGAPERAADFHWLRWLPHVHALETTAPFPMLAGDAAPARPALQGLLEELRRRQNQLHGLPPGQPGPAWPWLVLLAEDAPGLRDDPALHLLLSPIGRTLNVTAIFLVEQVHQVPTGCVSVVELTGDGTLAGCTDGELFTGTPDRADVATAEALTRALAPLRVETLRPEGTIPTTVRLLDLLGIADPESYDAAHAWSQRAAGRFLRVPIGLRRGGQPLELDLNPTAHGPHGLVAGTTGSGKSELLQTLVVALALTHHPHDLGFVLVDFKGGGAFAGLRDLPHTLGLVTDLSGSLAERALVTLGAEMERRKRLFSAVGVNDIAAYQRLYWQGRAHEPLSRLVIIVDEFAELVGDVPEFMDGLIGVARVGRSLGLHLILATQSPAGVVGQQIWANARFRICLRVESRQESVEMLHRPEAADLPRLPGRGYLQVGNNEVFELFQVARVAGRCPPGGEAPPPRRIVVKRVLPSGRTPALPDGPPERTDGAVAWPSDLERVVRRLADAARELRLDRLPSPWPDPLPDAVALPDLLRRAGLDGWDGARWALPPERPWLTAVLGLLDDPAHQRQFPLRLELEQQDGHLLIVGAPGSGQEMALRTLLMSLARTHTPAELHVYLIECAGQALAPLERLPHVGGRFTSSDEERVPRLLRRLLDALEERKRLCGEAGVDGLAQLRLLRPDKAPPAIVVVVTGLLEFRNTFPDELLALTRLVREGGPYGIHLLLAAERVGDVPGALGSVIARRLALRLAEPTDYGLLLGMPPRLGREQRFPVGRGWSGRPPLEFQAAAPCAGNDEAGELQRTVEAMAHAWRGPRPEAVESLPATVPLRPLLARCSPPPGSLAVPVGLDAVRLQPVLIDLLADGPDFLIAGTPQSGKTTLLLGWLLALAARYPPQQVRFVLIAGRRNSLAPLERLPHVLGYGRTPDGFRQDGVLARLLDELGRREAAWNDGASLDNLPRLVFVCDDYDEFLAAAGGEVEVQRGLAHLARRGRDVGVHLLLSGPLPGLGAGFNDPLLRQARAGRSGFLLRPLDPGEQNPFGLRVRPADVRQAPPGRGYLLRGGVEQRLQVATPGDAAAVAAWADEIARPAPYTE